MENVLGISHKMGICSSFSRSHPPTHIHFSTHTLLAELCHMHLPKHPGSNSSQCALIISFPYPLLLFFSYQ